MSDIGTGSERGDVNAQLSSFSERISLVNSDLADLEDAMKSSRDAVNMAISSVGGPGTKIGGTIQSCVRELNDEEFNTTLKSVHELLDGTKKISAVLLGELDLIAKKIMDSAGEIFGSIGDNSSSGGAGR